MEIKIKYFLKFLIILGIFSTINSQNFVFPKDDEADGIALPSRTTATFGSCYTPSRRPGSCVRIRDCRNIWQLIEKQASYQLSYSELVYLRNSQCGEDNGSVLVCCEAAQIMPDTSPTTKAPVRPQTGPRPNTSNLLPSPGQCASVSGKIYGGKETDLGEFPWMALIEYTKNTGEKSHHCSGSLINDRYIVTAAHCTIGKVPPKFTLSGARLGEWDKTKNIDCMTDTNGDTECADPHIDLAIEKTIYHPGYNASSVNQYHDIALLRLNSSIKYTRWIQPICLPLEKNLKDHTFLNHKLDISGWGKTENAKASAIKLKTTVEIVQTDVCNSKYSEFKIAITDKQLCAGGVLGTDTCNGDSGGPLIAQDHQNIPPKYFIAGVVSYGPSPCGLEGWAGVYTKVSEYTDWILENIEP